MREAAAQQMQSPAVKPETIHAPGARPACAEAETAILRGYSLDGTGLTL
jgi:hypothetical protein